MLALLASAAFIIAGTLVVYFPGPLGLVLCSAGLALSAAVNPPASPAAWPLALALVITVLAGLGGSWLERSARLPGGASAGELARTVTGQLGALTAGTLLFGPVAGAGLFAAVSGRHYPYSMLDTTRYLVRRALARALRLLAVALAAALAGGYAVAR
jgi:hypothetical protein